MSTKQNPNLKYGKEIIRYIKEEHNGRRYIVGALVAYNRKVGDKTFYLGLVLKHKEDWAIYDCEPNGYSGKDKGKNVPSYPIIGSLPFDKSIALETARSRAISWTMCPHKAFIPPSISDELMLFTDRARRYFKTDYIPNWMSQDSGSLKAQVESIYQDRERKRKNRINYLVDQRKLALKNLQLIESEIQRLSPSDV